MIFVNLKAELIKRKITPLELAQHLNISLPLLDQKLNGTQEFTLDEIIKLHSLFPDVSYDYLLYQA